MTVVGAKPPESLDINEITDRTFDKRAFMLVKWNKLSPKLYDTRKQLSHSHGPVIKWFGILMRHIFVKWLLPYKRFAPGKAGGHKKISGYISIEGW